jgi:hypothetical protein
MKIPSERSLAPSVFPTFEEQLPVHDQREKMREEYI